MNKCSQCEQDYWIDVVVASEIWERIASDGAYALCRDCFCSRLEKLNEVVPCVLHSTRRELRSYPEFQTNWRFEPSIQNESRGHPRLFGWFPQKFCSTDGV